jgi:hypothetical protein
MKTSRWCESDRWPNPSPVWPGPRQRMYQTSVNVPRRPRTDSIDKREEAVVRKMLI